MRRFIRWIKNILPKSKLAKLKEEAELKAKAMMYMDDPELLRNQFEVWRKNLAGLGFTMYWKECFEDFQGARVESTFMGWGFANSRGRGVRLANNVMVTITDDDYGSCDYSIIVDNVYCLGITWKANINKSWVSWNIYGKRHTEESPAQGSLDTVSDYYEAPQAVRVPVKLWLEHMYRWQLHRASRITEKERLEKLTER